MGEIDEYLDKNATQSQRAVLTEIRKIIRELIPEVDETISYGIPTFKYKGKYVVYFAAYKNHMSLHPAINTEALPELEKFRTGKGTLQFTEENLIPEPLLKQFIKLRFEQTKASKKDY